MSSVFDQDSPDLPLAIREFHAARRLMHRWENRTGELLSHAELAKAEAAAERYVAAQNGLAAWLREQGGKQTFGRLIYEATEHGVYLTQAVRPPDGEPVSLLSELSLSESKAPASAPANGAGVGAVPVSGGNAA